MTQSYGRFSKQSTETIDYRIDLSEWFSNREDAIDSVDVSADAGITVVDSTFSGDVVVVYISGGTSGTKYKVTVRITTDNPVPVVKEVDFFVVVKDV